MIKAVLQAISVYAMSVFLLPKQLIHRMTASICNFWWGTNNRCGIAYMLGISYIGPNTKAERVFETCMPLIWLYLLSKVGDL